MTTLPLCNDFRSQTAAKRKPLPPFDKIKSVHVIGVCGTLMGAFAVFLKNRGIEVTGSDQNIYPPMSDVLQAAQVKLFSGYDAANLTGLPRKPDVVVIGNVITPQNPEARAAIDGGYVFSSLPEAMEELMLKETRNCVVAGTHGKTTTSSLLAHVLSQAGREPSYFIGGVSKDLPQSFQVSKLESGTPFVLEGDEYDTAFWDKVPKFNHYRPDQVILTSVEYDHADIYPDFEAVFRAFQGLLSRIRAGGQLIACLDYDSVRRLIVEAKVPVIGYASRPAEGVRYWPANVRAEGEGMRFDVMDRGQRVADLRVQLPGFHNVMNALAVWIQCEGLGVAQDKTREGLASFQGVKRRQEERGEVRGVLVIDDFAHHPTAVRETLRALKLKYPERRVVAVFEPRSATSRRKVFQKDYAEAFCEAASTFIAIPFDQSNIDAKDQFSSEQLVADIRERGLEADVMVSVEEGVKQVARSASKGDLLAVLSNGGFGGFIPKLLHALQ